jgi:hypothetical protein
MTHPRLLGEVPPPPAAATAVAIAVASRWGFAIVAVPTPAFARYAVFVSAVIAVGLIHVVGGAVFSVSVRFERVFSLGGGAVRDRRFGHPEPRKENRENKILSWSSSSLLGVFIIMPSTNIFTS